MKRPIIASGIAREYLTRHKVLSLVLVAFVLLGFTYSVINPLYEGTDELRHFRFVRVLADTGKLPVQGQEPKRSQSHHPPLYYAVSAVTTFWLPHQGEPYLTRIDNPFWGYRYWDVGTDNKNMYIHGSDEAFPWSGASLAAHIARFINIGFGTLTVLLTAVILLSICPQKPGLAYGAAALVAFNPMFLYMSSTVNNDVAAAAAGAAITLACILVLRDGLFPGRTVLLGFSFGISLLAKFHLVFFLPLIELVILFRSVRPVRRHGKSSTQTRLSALDELVRANLIFLGVSAAIAGWWFIRNQVLYGDPTGFTEVTELWGIRSPWESIGLAWSELDNVWSSLWGRFGYGQIPMPDWVYQVLAWFTTIGLAGLIPGVFKRARGLDPNPKRSGTKYLAQLLFLLFTVLTFSGVLFGYMLVSPAGSMGRFFFPGLSALAILIIIGWADWRDTLGTLITKLGKRRLSTRNGNSPWLPAILGVLMFALSIWALVGFLAPAYARPRTSPSNANLANLEVTFSDPDGPLVELKGYQVSTDSIRPGDTIEITLSWHTLRAASSHYPLFIHLVDEAGVVVAQRDTYHGTGNYPSGFWQTDHTFTESYLIDVPQTAYAPTILSIEVGMYSREWIYRLEPTIDNGERAVSLGIITLESLPGNIPNPQSVNFDDTITLVGYQMTRRAVAPGEKVVVELYWTIPKTPEKEYSIFLHALDQENEVQAVDDGRLGSGMKDWPLDKPVIDERSLRIPIDAAPGFYQVELGVWPSGKPSKRLPILGEDGHWIDERLLLSPIRVIQGE